MGRKILKTAKFWIDYWANLSTYFKYLEAVRVMEANLKNKRDLNTITKQWLLFTVIFPLVNLVFLKHDRIKHYRNK